MRLRWNHDGKGPHRIPARLAAFASAKRREFLRTMAASALAGFALGRVAAWSCAAAWSDAAALLTSAASMTVAIVLALVLGALA